MGEIKRKGEFVMWCQDCQEFVAYPEGTFDNVCRRCGEPMVRRKCIRCGHEWTPRKRGHVIERCPRCKSPFWNRTRVMFVGKGGKDDGDWDFGDLKAF